MLKLEPRDYIPYSYVKQREEYEQSLAYKEWKSNLPGKLVDDFVSKGLVPFLKQKGYEIGFKLEDCIRYCYQWAYAHVQMHSQKSKGLQRYFLKSANMDYIDEKDWFLLQFDNEEWNELAECWYDYEFLDDSEIGYAQRLDLSEFAWQLVDLNQSKSHWKWLDIMEGEAGEEDEYAPLHQEESIAFGGDRRTL